MTTKTQTETRMAELLERFNAIPTPNRNELPAPTPEEVFAEMNLPEGEFLWEGEAGDDHAICGETGWYTASYALDIGRKDGKLYMEHHSIVEGDPDLIGAWTEGDPERDWQQFYNWDYNAGTDDYFRGWFEYAIDCVKTGKDPLKSAMNPDKIADWDQFWLDAAADSLRYLEMRLNPNTQCLVNMQCPNCGHYGPFRISVMTIGLFSDHGIEELPHDTSFEWEDDSWCQCPECTHDGTVATFTKE